MDQNRRDITVSVTLSLAQLQALNAALDGYEADPCFSHDHEDDDRAYDPSQCSGWTPREIEDLDYGHGALIAALYEAGRS